MTHKIPSARPILFCERLVPKLLDGSKRVTRRVTNDTDSRPCPYGDEGDLLWVRHAHWRGFKGTYNDQVWDPYTRCTRWRTADREVHGMGLQLDARGEHVSLRKVSGRYLPKWAACIWLRIVTVRRQRLHAMSWVDALTEGADSLADFRDLWDRLNARRGYAWEANPSVWVIEFERADYETIRPDARARKGAQA